MSRIEKWELNFRIVVFSLNIMNIGLLIVLLWSTSEILPSFSINISLLWSEILHYFSVNLKDFYPY
jgi:hypothetical protein